MPKQILLNGIKLHYLEQGKGFPLLLLHGWGGSSASFCALAQYLSPHYRLLIPDFPGFGQTPEPKTAWTVDDYADLVQEFVISQNLKDFILIGHSFGGRVSIKAASRSWSGLKGIILCSSAGIKPVKNLKHKMLFWIAKIGGKILQMPVLNQTQTFAKKILYKLAGSKDYLKVSGIMKETFKKVIAEDLKPLLPKIKTPTLIVWGKNDQVTPLADAQIMQREIINSELVIIDDARHGVHFQQPEKLSRAILKFLQKNRIL